LPATSSGTGVGREWAYPDSEKRNRVKERIKSDGEPVQIPAGSAGRGLQGHLAHAPRNRDHHSDGVHHGGGVESIREQAKQRGLEELFEQVLVPTEKVTEVRRGRKVDTERKFFPGYVLVKMNLTDEAFHLIKNTPKVTGFLGADNRPQPISEAEAMRIMHQVQEGVERPKPSVSFEIGENVRVADGPFASFSGVVEEIDEARSRVKVAVSIFGRATPVELEFAQVEKV
jgi:transcriptional antiterminator NusG